MQILVTGATGYAGRRVSAALARAGHTVLGLTRDPSTAQDLVVDEVTPVAGDLAEPDTWRPHLDGTDAVVHLVLDLDDPAGTDRGLFAEIAEAYARVLDREPAGEVFAIADDQRLTALDVQRVAVRAAGFTGEIRLEPAEAGGTMQVAADQDELVSGAKAHRLLGRRPGHTSFTDDPGKHHRAWDGGRRRVHG